MQMEMWAYVVAKHYSISLTEAYAMSPTLFRQSLAWALAIDEEQAKERRRSGKQAASGRETISLDYMHQLKDEGI